MDGDWPTYRHDAARSGAGKTSIPAELSLHWQVDLKGQLTSPVVAANRIFVADKTGRTLFCLDAQTGTPCWRFTGAGALDSPPTYAMGLVFFGSLDGHVYALRASDGALVWQYRAAPLDRRIVSDGHLESVWPVSGSVLVLDGVVYGAAGRSSHLDGGIYMFGLEASTGQLLYSKRICARPSQSSAGKMSPISPKDTGPDVIQEPALPDVLLTDGTSIMMRQLIFDKKLTPCKPSNKSGKSFVSANSGLLEDAWSARYKWSFAKSSGKLIVFDNNDNNAVYSLEQPYALVYGNQPASHSGAHHQKFTAYTTNEFPIGVSLTGGSLRSSSDSGASKKKNSHREILPLQARAMVLAGQRLYIAGWLDRLMLKAGSGAAASTDPAGPPQLWVLSTVDGKKVAEYPLSAPPVFDGLIAAHEKLYVSTSDGKLACFGSKPANP
jgi:outer membrane protein assembly factor BamB